MEKERNGERKKWRKKEMEKLKKERGKKREEISSLDFP